MRNMLLTGLLVAMTPPVTAAPQGACPPDEPKPRHMVERIALEPGFRIVLDDASIDHLTVDDIRVLSPETDGAVCGLLNAWVRRYQDKARHPRARWTFYEAQHRYLVMYWIAPAPDRQTATVNMNHPEKGWILNEDLDVLTSFMM